MRNEKPGLIFEIVRDFDIIFLAETHTTESSEKDIEKVWGNKYVFEWCHHKAQGSQRNGMCLIMKNNDANLHGMEITKDGKDGRWIEVILRRGVLASDRCKITGLYVPSSSANNERPSFLKSAMKRWGNWEESAIVVADWNATLDPIMDRTACRSYKEQGAAEISQWMEQGDLHDAYRRRYQFTTAEGTAWTFKRGLTRSRLDRFLVSDKETNRTQKVGIHPTGDISDHSVISLTWGAPQKDKRDPRLWRMSEELIDNPVFCEDMTSLLQRDAEAAEPRGLQADERWKNIKTEAQTIAKKHQRQQGKTRAKARKKRENEDRALRSTANIAARWHTKKSRPRTLGVAIREVRWLARKHAPNLPKPVRTAIANLAANLTSARNAARARSRVEPDTTSPQLCQTHITQMSMVANAAQARAAQCARRVIKDACNAVEQRRSEDKLEEDLKTCKSARALLRRATMRQKGKQRGITALTDEHGQVTKDEHIMQDVACGYWQDLWKKRLTVKAQQEKLLSIIRRKISPMAKRALNMPLSQKEVASAIKLLSNGKSPGIDGLPIEWYKRFSKSITPILCAALQYMIDQKCMLKDMTTAVVVLLFKKTDPTRMKYYRPISLLCTDYKILAKIIAERIKKVLPRLIHPDQQGFVQGGDIRGNILLQKMATRFCQAKASATELMWEEWEEDAQDEEYGTGCADERGGIAVFYDGEKAYDRQDREFMLKVLQAMNLGGGLLLQAIETMYNNTKAVIKMNGKLTKEIDVCGGVRQGCPLSCYLYILVVEPLAEMIRRDENIKGLILPAARRAEEQRMVKVSLFADDMTGYVQGWESLRRMHQCMKVFEKASGALVNIEKTFVLVMGTKWKGNEAELLHKTGLGFTLMGSTDVERYLGELITHSGQDSGDYERVMVDAHKIARMWSRFRLKLHSRVRVANVMIMFKILYRSSVAGLGKSEMKQIQDAMRRFVWRIPQGDAGKRKKAGVSLALSRRRWEHGGMGLRDVRVMALAARCRPIQRLREVYDAANARPGRGPQGILELPAWAYWLMREVKAELHALRPGFTVQNLWAGELPAPPNQDAGRRPRRKKPKRMKWDMSNYAQSCAAVWWQLASRREKGIKWLQSRRDRQDYARRIKEREADDAGDPEFYRQWHDKWHEPQVAKLDQAMKDLLNNKAFLCAHPQRVVSIHKMTANMVYWTLIAVEDEKKPKTSSIEGVKDEEGCYLREKRLRRTTMVGDEKEKWFRLRNGNLRLGHSMKYLNVARLPKGCGAFKPRCDRLKIRKMGKCCLCRTAEETWQHAMRCPILVKWIWPWIQRTTGMTHGLKKDAEDIAAALWLEREKMTRLQVELFSKLWCAWYDMWQAWRKHKVRSVVGMRAWWLRRWRKRVARAIRVDLRNNEKKARKKWKDIMNGEGVDWTLNLPTNPT